MLCHYDFVSQQIEEALSPHKSGDTDRDRGIGESVR
jgi:hypothetical protein